MRAALSVHRPLRSENSPTPLHTFRLSWALSMISASGLSPPEQTPVDSFEAERVAADLREVQCPGSAHSRDSL
jgi:hypothetical protein